MKILVIAEKPSVARDIARVLKCNKKKDGCLYSDTYIVSWAIGHLVTLYDPEDYDIKLKKWKIESLPIIPNEIKIKAINNTKSQFKLLKKLMNDKDVEYIICATDSGREGELIFRYIYELSNCKKVFKRLWISSMTDSAIKEGFKKLKNSSEYDNLYLSAKCRSQADWLVGINASRAFTIKYGTLLSIGRVQTPTLAIIVKRQEEIDSFVSKPYWEVEGDFETYKGVWFEPKSNDTKIFDKQKAEDIKKKTSGKNGIVISVEEEKKTKLPPFLYDLTQLQRDCNKKYSFSAKKTLSVVQELYEKRKLVTYPRTDSRYLSDDMIPKLKNILYKINEVSEYKKFSEYVLNLNKLPISKRIVAKFSLTPDQLLELSFYCKEAGIGFSATPYSREEVDFLVDKIDAPFIKIASMEINNLPFLRYIGEKGIPIVLSTGMSLIDEIRNAVEAIEETGNRNLCILHCVSVYPAPAEIINLNNMVMLQEEFPEYVIGYSDHTIGYEVAAASIALGAALVEKHFTLDNKKMGMDNNMATEPAEMKSLVNACHSVYSAMGARERVLLEGEEEQRLKMRRSLVATRDIEPGETIMMSDLEAKRPGDGIAPNRIKDIIGKKAANAIPKGYFVRFEHLN